MWRACFQRGVDCNIYSNVLTIICRTITVGQLIHSSVRKEAIVDNVPSV